MRTRTGEINTAAAVLEAMASKKKGNPNIHNVDKDARPELRPGSRTCQCVSCGHFFTGVAPFDRHLVVDDERGNVECLSVPQMYALGMVTNKHGVWQYGLSLKAQAA